MTAIRHTEAFWLDSQLDCPFRDRLWNLAPFQATAVQKLPRTRAGWGTRPWVCTRSTLQSQKEQKNHGKASKTARLRKGPHFLWPHKSQTTPLQELRRNQSKEWVITKNKKAKQKKTIQKLFINTVDPYIQSLVAVWSLDVKCKSKASFWKLAIPVEKLFRRAPRYCCWGNLCCAGSPQRSVSTQQRYAGGGTAGCLGYVVLAYVRLF